MGAGTSIHSVCIQQGGMQLHNTLAEDSYRRYSEVDAITCLQPGQPVEGMACKPHTTAIAVVSMAMDDFEMGDHIS